MATIELHQSKIPFGDDNSDFVHHFWVFKNDAGNVIGEIHGHPSVNGVAFGGPQSNDTIDTYFVQPSQFNTPSIRNVHGGPGYWSTAPENKGRPAQEIFNGSQADVQQKLDIALNSIPILNDQDFDYILLSLNPFDTGQNSNSVAYSIGRVMGFDPVRLPLGSSDSDPGGVSNAPGWGRDIIQQTIDNIDAEISGLNSSDPNYQQDLANLQAQRATLDNPEYQNRSAGSDVINFEFNNVSFSLPRAQAVKALEDGGCFLPGTMISMADGSEKPIEEIAVGDWVTSYDKSGKLVAGRVSQTMQQHSKHILDLHGLMITPGHVTLCGDGRYAGRHIPVIDILRSDGALVREDGTKVRAATNCALGSLGDQMIWAITGDVQADGMTKVRDKGQIRLGTRFIRADGRDVSILDLIRESGAMISEDGMIQRDPYSPKIPFRWSFTQMLPKPEDYILQRSQLMLHEIYEADEWEAMRPLMPVPHGAMPSGDPSIRDQLPPNLPLSMAGQSDQPTMNRKQRKALAAKQRKVSKAIRGKAALH